MNPILTSLPPYVVLAAAAFLVLGLPRRAGHAAAALATAFTFAQAVLLGDGGTGAYVATQLFGFDVILFNVDQFSLLMGSSSASSRRRRCCTRTAPRHRSG